jgi:hypothetical protein
MEKKFVDEIKIGISDDYIRKNYGTKRPLDALCELIDNSMDAWASKIWIDYDYSNGLLTISDNGGGSSFKEITEKLPKLGNSSKVNEDKNIGLMGVGYLTSCFFLINPFFTKRVESFFETDNLDEKTSFEFIADMSDNETPKLKNIHSQQSVSNKSGTKISFKGVHFEDFEDYDKPLGKIYCNAIMNKEITIYLNGKTIKPQDMFYRDFIKREGLKRILKTKTVKEKYENEEGEIEEIEVTISHFVTSDLFENNDEVDNSLSNCRKFGKKNMNEIDGEDSAGVKSLTNNGLYIDIMGKYILCGGANSIASHIGKKIHYTANPFRIMVSIPPKYRTLLSNPIKTGTSKFLCDIKNKDQSQVFRQTCNYIKNEIKKFVDIKNPSDKKDTKLQTLIKNNSLKYFSEMLKLSDEILNETDVNTLIKKSKELASIQRSIVDEKNINFEKINNSKLESEIEKLQNIIRIYEQVAGSAVNEKVKEILAKQSENN